MSKLSLVDWVALALVVIGGLNWGLIGVADFNLVTAIFGMTLTRVVYILVGLSAIYVAFGSVKMGKK